MSEIKKQAAFLKTLLMYEDSAEHRALCERLANAQTSERCILCACRLVGLLALLGLAGIGYSAVLLPQFFDQATHVVIRVFSALGLGSSFCFLVFVGIWFWYRSSVARIHNECRRAITKMLETRLHPAHQTFYPVLVEDPQLKVDEGRVTKLPKAS